MSIKSGDRIDTGTGPSRRRLTEAEAQAGGLPTPWTTEEKQIVHNATHVYAQRLLLALIREIRVWR